MPRQARLDAPGVLHHIMIRGIEGRKIFRINEDRNDFIERLERLLPKTQTACYAWAFLPNHAHFLFRTGKSPIATLMRRLLTGYVVCFNKRHNRTGQLFQNRYKSIVCQEDVYLRELVRYIHLNPIRSGVVQDLIQLSSYPYSGHPALAGKNRRDWQDTDYVLRYFGKTVRHARKEYLSFMEAGIGQGRRDDLMGGGLVRSLGGWAEVKAARIKAQDHMMSDERILGEGDFVDSILSLAHEEYDEQYKLKRRGYDFDLVVKEVAAIVEMQPDEILSKGKQPRKVEARSLLCYWAVNKLGMSLTDVARRQGMTPAGVGYAAQRGETIAIENNYSLMV
ncbi:MAG: transposase [Deltaproteobacteria bacterium]|nr:transposase [Deltaproteobacteria bacterium]